MWHGITTTSLSSPPYQAERSVSLLRLRRLFVKQQKKTLIPRNLESEGRRPHVQHLGIVATNEKERTMNSIANDPMQCYNLITPAMLMRMKWGI